VLLFALFVCDDRFDVASFEEGEGFEGFEKVNQGLSVDQGKPPLDAYLRS
jgi:hypothetical protein